MRVLFSSLPAYGHLYPLMPLMLACQEQGHDVVMATGEEFADRMGSPLIGAFPANATLSWAERETAARHPDLLQLPSSERWRFALEMFADVTAGRVAELMLPLIQQLRPDLVIYEVTNVGVGVAADVAGIPSFAHALGQWSMLPAALHAAALQRQAQIWETRGSHPPTATGVLARGYLDLWPPSLQDPVAGTPPARIPIRPQPWSEPLGNTPDWLQQPRRRPRVYLTLGTVSFDAVDALRAALAGLAQLDVDVLVTVGPKGESSLLGEPSARFHVERFVPQTMVLPYVDAVVSHGGAGTLLGALGWGLPQVVLPQGADQYINGQTVAGSGVGRCLLGEEMTPSAVAAAVEAVLTDGPERAAARGLQAEIAALPSPAEVVPVLEALSLR